MDFDKLFPDVRETGETPLRQSQLVMLRMLKIFDHLCNKYNIQYFLTGGSLIGAVRHNGFIPWDDDLDVGMTRENYELFIEKAVKELPGDIFFQSEETDKYYPSCHYVEAKLRDKYSSYVHLPENNDKWHDGFQLDIFVYDRAFFPNNFLIICQNRLLNILDNNKKRGKILKWISKYSPFSLVYASTYLKDFGQLKLGTYLTEKEYSKIIKYKFEDTEASIPQGWDTYLKRQYGNYMKLPPEEKRVSNHNVILEPFKPCNHSEILMWENKRKENFEEIYRRDRMEIDRQKQR